MKTTVEIPDFLLEDTTTLEPEAQVLLTLIRAWLARPESRRRLKLASEELGEAAQHYVFSATHHRLPETLRERRNGFALWLAQQVRLHEDFIEQTADQAVVRLRPSLSLTGQAQFVAEELLGAQLRREARRQLRLALAAWVIQEYAARWTGAHLGQAYAAGAPQRRSGLWLVPVLDGRSAAWVTTLRLTPTGEPLSDPKALLDEIEVRQIRRIGDATRP